MERFGTMQNENEETQSSQSVLRQGLPETPRPLTLSDLLPFPGPPPSLLQPPAAAQRAKMDINPAATYRGSTPGVSVSGTYPKRRPGEARTANGGKFMSCPVAPQRTATSSSKPRAAETSTQHTTSSQQKSLRNSSKSDKAALHRAASAGHRAAGSSLRSTGKQSSSSSFSAGSHSGSRKRGDGKKSSSAK